MADRDGILIRFASTITDFLTGKNRVRDELKDVGKGLDEVADASSNQADTTSAGLREVEDAASDAGDAASESVDSIGDSADSVGGKLGDLGQVGRKVLDGDISGAAESAAGAVTNLGPIGLVAGTVLAAGIGIASGAIKDQQKEVDELKARYSAMYKAAIEEGRTFIGEAQIQTEVLDIMWNPDRADEYNAAQKAAKDTGVELTTVLRGLAGDQSAAADIVAVTSTRVDDLKEKVAGFQGAVQGTKNPVLESYLEQQHALEAVRDKYKAIIDIQDENASKAETSQKIITEMHREEQEQVQRTSDADQARFEGLAEAIKNSDVDVKVSVKTPDAATVVKQMQREVDKQPPVTVKVQAKGFGRTFP